MSLLPFPVVSVAAGVFLVSWPRLQTQAGTVSLDQALTLMPPTHHSSPFLQHPQSYPVTVTPSPSNTPESPVRSVRSFSLSGFLMVFKWTSCYALSLELGTLIFYSCDAYRQCGNQMKNTNDLCENQIIQTRLALPTLCNFVPVLITCPTVEVAGLCIYSSFFFTF